jgi:hypothetical protein
MMSDVTRDLDGYAKEQAALMLLGIDACIQSGQRCVEKPIWEDPHLLAVAMKAIGDAAADAWESAASHVNCYHNDPDELGEVATALVGQFKAKAAAIRGKGKVSGE